MGRGSSKAGGKGGTQPINKPFSQMSLDEKKVAISDFEKSMDSRFPNYSYGNYKIYKVSNGQYAAYKFTGLKDSFINNATNTTYFAVLYGNTLKGIRKSLGV